MIDRERDWDNGPELIALWDNPFSDLAERVNVAARRVAANDRITGTDPESRMLLHELRQAVNHAEKETERVRQIMRDALKKVFDDERQKRDATPPQ